MTLDTVLPLHDALVASRRIAPLPARAAPTRWDVALLAATGVATAVLGATVKLRIGVPGHAILTTVLPLSCGLALVPRRRAGTLMGAVGLATMIALGETSFGAMTALFATGALLDVALARAKPGVRLYGAFVAAGAAANLLAFVGRGVGKVLGFSGTGGALEVWYGRAILPYLACGAVAGLASAAAWFHLRGRRSPA
ncbi:MAG TPA: hypothetical protein VHB21_08545 [Minicystis sp.]|nr:hypothetical protein [Minicystis sp.]